MRVMKARGIGILVALGAVGWSGVAHGLDGDDLKSPSGRVPDKWLTKAERTDFRETARYDETIEYCRRLAASSPWIEYRSFGRSGEGRELPLLIVSRRRTFTPEAAVSSHKVLVQNCIHAGECAGKDASLMLVRDIAITATQRDLLDHVVLLVIPIFNVDGHERFGAYSRVNQNGPAETGWRTTSRNYNLNRDFIKADAVETRAWLALWNRWRPDFHFDNHTTDGGDWQYDVIFDANTHATGTKSVTGWISEVLYSSLFASLRADGHTPAIYFNLVDRHDPSKGITSGGFGPRFATGYVSIRNRPSLLVEMHALKPYRTRVIGNYNIMRDTLALLNRDPDSLRSANQEADAETVKRGRSYDADAQLTVSVRRTDEETPFLFKGFAHRREASDISGTDRVIYDNTQPVEFETVWKKKTEPAKKVSPPLGYVIPPQWTEAIDLVRLHGLEASRLVEAASVDVQSYRFENVSWAKRSYEGRLMPKYETVTFTERRELAAGSVVVRLDQVDAKAAIHMLEPEAPDSLVRWGFFNTIFEQKEYGEMYVLEKLAREMLRENPSLREAFDAQVKSDEAFASNPWARLYFFYRRSPYWDRALNVYPVSRLTKPLTAKTEPLGG